jgi:predicted signal transduction protein with EAL and GGDEF domain
MGGDEFAILISDMDSPDEAVSVAEKLLTVLGQPYQLQNQDVLSGGSIGLAFYPDDTQESENLLRYADMAMYQAKQSGRGAYACFSAQLDQHAHEKMQLHVRLREAIDLGVLRLFYQPQVDVVSGGIVGAEALLRWNDAALGEVSPARFIPIAETTGLILPLSDWVLETACQQIAAWELGGTPLRVAVNFSAQQFRQGNLPAKVHAVLKRTGASAKLLEIEITESVAMEHPALAREQLEALVELGCKFALDDFGTGYSSLAYLKALPVSVIALAHSLDMTLVAEGVETVEQLEFLREQGCGVYQGWFFAQALDGADLTRRLRAEPVQACGD